MTKRRRKVLPAREQEKADAKRQAHLQKRADSEQQRWMREHIDPIFDRIAEQEAHPDDIRSYPPTKPEGS